MSRPRFGYFKCIHCGKEVETSSAEDYELCSTCGTSTRLTRINGF